MEVSTVIGWLMQRMGGILGEMLIQRGREARGIGGPLVGSPASSGRAPSSESSPEWCHVAELGVQVGVVLIPGVRQRLRVFLPQHASNERSLRRVFSRARVCM